MPANPEQSLKFIDTYLDPNKLTALTRGELDASLQEDGAKNEVRLLTSLHRLKQLN